MVVEDNEFIRKTIEVLCKTVGVEYKMGADGVEGVQIVEDFLR